jgi:DNA invertase Pin-like site-specific DNA recombinase
LGLGLEAQREALERFAQANGLLIVAEFTKIETDKGADALELRPQLASALNMARKRKCSVAVAKLDRLSRDVHFISGLINGVRLVDGGRNRQCNLLFSDGD